MLGATGIPKRLLWPLCTRGGGDRVYGWATYSKVHIDWIVFHVFINAILLALFCSSTSSKKVRVRHSSTTARRKQIIRQTIQRITQQIIPKIIQRIIQQIIYPTNYQTNRPTNYPATHPTNQPINHSIIFAGAGRNRRTKGRHRKQSH